MKRERNTALFDIHKVAVWKIYKKIPHVGFPETKMNGKTTPGVWSRSNQKSAWGNFESAESHIEETLDFSVIIETHHSAVFSA